MIKFHEIQYKNILSTGNSPNKIRLDRDRTTLLSGQNGAGKSTVIEALVFALFGKPFRNIKKNQLLNSINKKDLLVELDFSIGTNSYKVRRGIKPNLFEIYRNGEMLNQQASVREQQEFLENDILRINYKSFTQIVVLGSAEYKPFMQLPAASRREVIEDLLDIRVFSTMNSILKKDWIADNKERQSEKEHEIENIETKLEALNDKSESLIRVIEEQQKSIKEKINENVSKVEGCDSKIEELKEKVKEYEGARTKIKSLSEKIKTCEQYESRIVSQLSDVEKHIDFYKHNENCPTCRQNLDPSFIERETAKLHESRKELQDGINKLREKKSRLEGEVKENEELAEKERALQNDMNEQIATKKIAIESLNSLKKDLEKTAAKKKETVDTNEIEDYKRSLEKAKTDYDELKKKADLLSVAAKILKDDGIKAHVMKEYMPKINALINKYLAEFELFADFNLDENFDEQIRSRHRDEFSYYSFSEGEKLRINLAILLTWRAISKMRNSNATNLLILDETLDGSADSQGVESLIDMLHSQNPDEHIFVVSHRGDEFGEKFENHLKFSVEKGFSVIEEEGTESQSVAA